MQELVETFLRLARETSVQEHCAVTTLHELAAEQIRSWQDEATRKGLDLGLVVESEDTEQYSVPLLRSVMSNLLRNALHYTDRGFVRLVLRDAGFSVIDSGVGIPESDRERMFAPFTRGDPSRGDGTGVGLSLV